MRKHALIVVFSTFSVFAQNDAETCEILSKINTLIQSEHINPKPIDDSLSVFVFDHLINELDPSRNIFLKSEYETLSQKYRFHIDDFINAKNCSFLSEIISVYKKDLSRNKSILEKINNLDIDYELKDTVRFYQKYFPFYLQEHQVEKVLIKKIRYQVLNEIVSKHKDLDSIKTNFKTLEFASKKIIIENELCKINTALQNETNYDENIFNYFCNYFDPHTSYFNINAKSSFVASLSKEHLSLGMNVSLNEKNEIIINELNPRGPAFQTGKIKKGDQIVSISNLKEKIDVSCATLDLISNMITSDTNTKIKLTLKRTPSKIFDVLVEKQLLKDEGNTVYSFVVEHENEKFGYIKIPSFYTDYDGNSGKGCAEDAALEALKLQKDNIKGLIIDLTDNGGGSIDEAIKLAGMLIDSGPISIIIDNKKVPMAINDPYEGMIYKDPIVILINSNSASASEFFASIMQDYNRALLIGASTIGKASMQTILPLEKDKDTIFLKLTINKFYRITGKSNQAVGIIPDVHLPELFETIYTKETDSHTALKNDSLAVNLEFKPYSDDTFVRKIAKESTERVAANSYFNEIKSLNLKLENILKKSKPLMPLTIDAFFKERKELNCLWEDIHALDSKTNGLDIHNSNLNQFLLTLYPLEKTSNQFQLETLKKNHYLHEAITILEDYNSLK
ncbi:S41 family peptidase [Flavobacterium granuli]|uniref:C-terminal processing peptidase-1. Serine peptidase. MEROPS family S41A n=1 Tax=Flavobacterium granuli TaxID=280093 RepID=A0A1M5I412_9FLAO|nr:S41 family peptidase [Flavobacterium granuli]PRZ27781.1 S41A family C-terminal processing peptidase-1 [Flavobacterium granuli]SHG23068.1 C-terminal processing peptidase-1. Serine peptidase. MEROPS family S41A [Flavobacterium granuli]